MCAVSMTFLPSPAAQVISLASVRSKADSNSATLWKSIGDAMSISYACLAHGPDKFIDGLQWTEDLRSWAKAYEVQAMVPSKYNHQVAEQTTDILLCNVPDFLKPAGKNLVASLMDERLRKAML
jgi:hypothetical protein